MVVLPGVHNSCRGQGQVSRLSQLAVQRVVVRSLGVVRSLVVLLVALVVYVLQCTNGTT
jgi:hypothetical protein